MNRGDIYVVDFDPSLGAEIDKSRPAIIVSNAGANLSVTKRQWGVVNVVPLTTSIGSVRKFQVLIPAQDSGLDKDSKAQAEQIRAVSAGRLGRQVGRVPPLLMNAVDEALRIQLAL